MPLKKLDDDKTWTRKVCRSPEHNPPGMMVYRPGTYEWTCPKCGDVTSFTVPLVTLGIVPRPGSYRDDGRRRWCSPWRSRAGRLSL